MNHIYRIFIITSALMVSLSAALSFAQHDNVTIKRTAGDFYDITISGERNGDFAGVQMVTTEVHKYMSVNMPLPAGSGPSLVVSAYVASGGDENAQSRYSLTFQEELPGPAWWIYYYVADSYNNFMADNLRHVKTISIRDYYPYNEHFNDGYHFDVDLTGSSFEPQPEGSVRVNNLKVEGFDDPFWATFQWNPRNLKFELKEAGPEN